MASCPACKASFDLKATPAPKPAAAALTVLKDWRVWVVALVTNLIAGVVMGGLQLPGSVGAASGAVSGLYFATRFMKVRACPSCEKAVIPTDAAPPPG